MRHPALKSDFCNNGGLAEILDGKILGFPDPVIFFEPNIWIVTLTLPNGKLVY